MTGYLNIPTDQLTTDVTLINTGEIRSIGSREFNTGDNLTGLVSVIPRLADVWVTKTLTSDAPAVPGDTVTYLVEYGNRGGRDASGVVIEDHIFSGLDILSAQTNPPIIYYPEDHTGHRLIYDLVAGET